MVRAAREGVTEAGVEGFEKAVRKTAGDDVADRVFREMGLDDLVGAAYSFSPETPVTTELGLRPISSLWRGLEVWAYNEATGEFGWYPITAVWSHLDETIVYLTIDGEVIETTPEHPFHTAAGECVAAGDLQVGDKIRRVDDSYGLVEVIVVVEQLQWMYNLTVAEAQTYFVGVGRWLVHNTCWQIGNRSVKDIVGNTQVKPGIQGVVDNSYVERYAHAMANDSFNWNAMRAPIRFAKLPDGTLVLLDGHHRFLAAQWTNTPIPWNNSRAVVIENHSYWPSGDWSNYRWSGY